MIMPKISRTELESLRELFLKRREDKSNYRAIADGLGLPSIRNFTQFFNIVTAHLSVQRSRIALSEKELVEGSTITHKGRTAVIKKIRNFDEEVGLQPFGGTPVLIQYEATKETRRCGGTMVEEFIKVS